MPSLDAEGGRLAPIRRRVTLAKAGFVVGAAAVFGTALAVARAYHPGQPKPRFRPLSASTKYLAAVQKNVGDAGIVQPALSSPTVATHVS
jgi:hypothetical protein